MGACDLIIVKLQGQVPSLVLSSDQWKYLHCMFLILCASWLLQGRSHAYHTASTSVKFGAPSEGDRTLLQNVNTNLLPICCDNIEHHYLGNQNSGCENAREGLWVGV